ncbi:urease accessory protein UreD [Pantoea sp. B65]|uniref:urease accessory protein UreD n=1 Tax=Pantoea sp. B65 TaxID=2813359 RepID=UPI0039B66A1E
MEYLKVNHAAQPQTAVNDAGWKAWLTLQLGQSAGKTRLLQQRHLGPLRVQRPFYPQGDTCHLYILHPPGGVVGGDELNTDVQLIDAATALITMPGAAKIYRSNGASAAINQRVRLQAGCAMEWLPPGNILFRGSEARISSEFHLAADSRLIAWETFCFGRPVMQENYDCGNAISKLRVWRDGEPLLSETLRVSGGLATLAGYPLHSTMLMYPASEALVMAVRAQLAARQHPAGATLLGDLLVIRLLDHSNLTLETDLHQLWRLARPQVIGLDAVNPRIWST